MKNYQQKAVENNQKKRELKSAPVTDYMVRAKDLVTFTPETEIMEVVDTLLEHEITGAPILDEKGKLVGLIDDKDCLKVIFDSCYHNQPVNNHTVAQYTTNVMKIISVHSDIYEVANVFLRTIFKRLLVVDDDGKLVGQISRQDILRAIHDFNTHAR